MLELRRQQRDGGGRAYQVGPYRRDGDEERSVYRPAVLVVPLRSRGTPRPGVVGKLPEKHGEAGVLGLEGGRGLVTSQRAGSQPRRFRRRARKPIRTP